MLFQITEELQFDAHSEWFITRAGDVIESTIEI